MSTIKRYAPINPKCPHFLHGGDYNPDQWITTPEVWDEDMRLMKLAGCNAMSIGIFSWMALEPEEGRFTFEWMDAIMDKLASNKAYAILATPSGAKPAWMSVRYPEVCKVTVNGRREHHHSRHNHCRTSPVYREKCRIINARLADRYKNHPALLVWHISNEFNGEPCYCDLCLQAFRTWLQKKYLTLDALNLAWWTGFWSHTFSDWSQIYPEDDSLHGMMLDWHRFNTEQTINFYLDEIRPLRQFTPHVPITTNFMGCSPTLDYWKFAQVVDVVAWDSYPHWHDPQGDHGVACSTAFTHDINRSMKAGQPFMLMESTPSLTNWQAVSKLKRPGMHLLSSIQAVAHGSDTVQYFQWRKGRGGSEKFHGAVVDHCGHEHNRVFREVAETGNILKRLDDVIGTTVRPEVAVVFDWENTWAIDHLQGLGKNQKNYHATCLAHYRTFWEAGVPVDVIDQTCPVADYKLLITPMLYLLRPGMAGKIKDFVANGGTWVATYWTGIVDQNDLCFTGGWPGDGLREVLGIWDEETDTIYPEEHNAVVMAPENSLKIQGRFKSCDIHALIHAETARVLATYGADFYKGRPALTVNSHQKGLAYYIASRNDERFNKAFYGRLIKSLGLTRALDVRLPAGVSAQHRTDGKTDFVFLMNFNPKPVTVSLKTGTCLDLVTGRKIRKQIALPGYGVAILRQ
ncbi:MAG: beta-galactosidase [bacterium]